MSTQILNCLSLMKNSLSLSSSCWKRIFKQQTWELYSSSWSRNWSQLWRGLVWRSRSCVTRTETVWFNRLMRVNVSRHFRYNYLMVSVDRMTSSSLRDTSGRLLTLKIRVNQMEQNSVIMRTKLSADTNNTQLLAILLFLLSQRTELWSMTRLCFVVPELMLLFSQLEPVLEF